MCQLDDVRLFAQVVRDGSFTAAARSLGLPKSTLSRRVAGLERALGVRLLQRTTRRLSLSEVGALYYERVTHALDELSHAERSVHALASAPRGVLRVSLPADFAAQTVADLLGRFAQRYPEIELVVDVTNRVVDLIAERYDVALRASSALPDSSLVARRLTSTGFALYASPDYLARAGTPRSPDDLRNHACLVFGSTRAQRRLRLHGVRGDEVTVDVRGPLACNDHDLLRWATLSGLGIATLPTISAAPHVNAQRLQRVLPDYDAGEGGLYAVYPSPQHLTSKLRAFIDFMSESLSNPDALAEPG